MEALLESLSIQLDNWIQQNNIRSRSVERIRQACLNGVEPPDGCRFRVPGLRSTEFWPSDEFDWVAGFERSAATIAHEYSTQSRLHPPASQPDMVAVGRWSVDYLTLLGIGNRTTRRRYPQSTAALDAVAAAESCGMAYFSRLDPGSHIRPHSGFTNAHLRCHLALETPPGAVIRVGSATMEWKQHACLVFDDSFEHEAWNSNSDHARVVLLFDFFHPDLTPPEIEALRALEQLWRRHIVLGGLDGARS